MIGVAAVDYRIWAACSASFTLSLWSCWRWRWCWDRARWRGTPLDYIRIFDVQPAEIAKYLVVLVLARYLAQHEDQMGRLPIALGAIGLVVLPPSWCWCNPMSARRSSCSSSA